MKNLIHKKIFHLCMLMVIIAIILFVVGISILRYSVEGEKNLPFNLSKIVVISNSEGIDKENPENKWAMDINQNNDIYLYIEKNGYYSKTEIIQKVTIDNFVINRTSEIGSQKIYKPNLSETAMFKNIKENESQSIEYIGDLQSDIKQLKISNQGGLVVFRYSLDKIGEYISNDEQEVNYNELLKKANIKNEDIVKNGTVNQEITDLTNVVFKRIENV